MSSLKRKCDHCDKSATHHSVEILKGQKIEKHLCDEHAAKEGLAIKATQTPINKLLTNFAKTQTVDATPQPEWTCNHCGMTFAEFREHSVLGCPECYTAFENPLSALLERAHEGGTKHLGKTPRRSDGDDQRQQQLLRLRKRLEEAVTCEDYELAARLRDEIQRHQEQPQ
jgi:protein arginine kinase activator